MESVAEKKEMENNDNSNGDNAQPILDSSSSPLSATAENTNAYYNNNNSKEARDFRERQARDLKAGLHPLKVFLSHSLSLSLSPHEHTQHIYIANEFLLVLLGSVGYDMRL